MSGPVSRPSTLHGAVAGLGLTATRNQTRRRLLTPGPRDSERTETFRNGNRKSHSQALGYFLVALSHACLYAIET